MTVGELFDRVLPRLKFMPPSIAFADAANAVQEVVARKLWENRSDLVREIWESDAEIPGVGEEPPTPGEDEPIGTASVTLPDRFLGIADDAPFILYEVAGQDQVATLAPRSRSLSSYATASQGIPSEYELRGQSLYLFPTSSVAFALRVPMFRKPAPLTAMEDDLPWCGMYDQLFQDAVLYLASPTGMLATVTPLLEQALRAAVDTGSAMRAGRKVQWQWA